MKNVQDIVVRIEKLCKDRNLTVNAMLKKSNLHSNVVNSMRNRNTMPNAETLWSIANALQISTDYLLKGCNDSMRVLITYLGEEFYTVKRIDYEDCICRTIGKYEIELSGCSKKKMCVSLYLWEISSAGNPLNIVAYRHDIRSKQELKKFIEYIEQNIDNVEDITYYGRINDIQLNKQNQSVSVQTLNDNHGIIGHAHAPVTIINGTEKKLTEQEIALVDLFGKLDVIKQAQLLAYAAELGKEV